MKQEKLKEIEILKKIFNSTSEQDIIQYCQMKIMELERKLK